MGACTQGLNDVEPDHALGTTNSYGAVDKPGEPLTDYKLPILKTKNGRLVFKDRNEFYQVSAKIGFSDAEVGESKGTCPLAF
jgi:hypothetical protein